MISIEIYLQGVFNKDRSKFRVTNIGFLDKRFNKIRKVNRIGVFVKRRTFNIKREKFYYLVYYKNRFLGVMKRFSSKIGWWKLELEKSK